MVDERVNATIIVHGGAGDYVDVDDPITAQHLEAKTQALQSITDKGWRMLIAGKPLPLVARSVIYGFEDNPEFNAGFGAEIGYGGVQLDAAAMNGSNMHFGGVIGVEGNRHPIDLALGIVDTPHNLYYGEFTDYDSTEDLTVPYRVAELEAYTEKHHSKNPLKDETQWGGTVGVVIFDGKNIFVATSTGGMTGKPKNRVGDSSVPGAGTFATPWGGASATGEGAPIMIQGTTRRAIDIMTDNDLSPQIASEKVIKELGSKYHGIGGIILLDAKGGYGAFSNAPHMMHAYRKSGMSSVDVVVRNERS